MLDLVKELKNGSAVQLEVWINTVCTNCNRHPVYFGSCETCPYHRTYEEVAEYKYGGVKK